MSIYYKIDVLKELKAKGYNTNVLRIQKLLSESTIQYLREDKMVSIKAIDTICGLLHLRIEDVITRDDD